MEVIRLGTVSSLFSWEPSSVCAYNIQVDSSFIQSHIWRKMILNYIIALDKSGYQVQVFRVIMPKELFSQVKLNIFLIKL